MRLPLRNPAAFVPERLRNGLAENRVHDAQIEETGAGDLDRRAQIVDLEGVLQLGRRVARFLADLLGQRQGQVALEVPELGILAALQHGLARAMLLTEGAGGGVEDALLEFAVQAHGRSLEKRDSWTRTGKGSGKGRAFQRPAGTSRRPDGSVAGQVLTEESEDGGARRLPQGVVARERMHDPERMARPLDGDQASAGLGVGQSLGLREGDGLVLGAVHEQERNVEFSRGAFHVQARGVGPTVVLQHATHGHELLGAGVRDHQAPLALEGLLRRGVEAVGRGDRGEGGHGTHAAAMTCVQQHAAAAATVPDRADAVRVDVLPAAHVLENRFEVVDLLAVRVLLEEIEALERRAVVADAVVREIEAHGLVARVGEAARQVRMEAPVLEALEAMGEDDRGARVAVGTMTGGADHGAVRAREGEVVCAGHPITDHPIET